jgi:hypothetical protein
LELPNERTKEKVSAEMLRPVYRTENEEAEDRKKEGNN